MSDARWPDGCPREAHTLDAICALGKVDVPDDEPAAETEDEREGGAT